MNERIATPTGFTWNTRPGHDARQYKLSPPLHLALDHDTPDEKTRVEYVMVSAVAMEDTISRLRSNETYIFPCDSVGEVLSWSELEGSYRGGMDHAEALRGLGYEVKS